MMEKRFAKLDLAAREIPDDVKVSYVGPDDAETVIVSWGSTKGAIRDALDRLGAAGSDIGYLHVRLINPFPVDLVARRLSKAKRRVAVEMNFTAQLAGIVREKTGIDMTHFILKYNGRPMSSTELVDALAGVQRGTAPARTVLTHGA
jgi:2-oxoglutarate ferredoxin oxidoreductase subunit alpha